MNMYKCSRNLLQFKTTKILFFITGLIISFTIITCSFPEKEDDGNISSQWQGWYSNSGNNFGGRGITCRLGSVSADFDKFQVVDIFGSAKIGYASFDRLSTRDGGSIISANVDIGNWMYIYQSYQSRQDETKTEVHKVGIVVEYISENGNTTNKIALGENSSELVNNLKLDGITLFPSPSGFNAPIGFFSDKISWTGNLTPSNEFLITGVFIGEILFNPNDFEIRPIGNNNSEITRFIGNKQIVYIPPIIRGLNITTISNNAFADKQLTNVTIPNSVTTIMRSAFRNNQLTSVTIPNSVSFLSGFNNNQLTSVTIPNSVTIIGDEAFANNQLTYVIIPNKVIIIYMAAFANNQLTSVNIPNSVTIIDEDAFANNPQLTSITIGGGLNIGTGAFPTGFMTLYNANGKLAGTYTVNAADIWSLH